MRASTRYATKKLSFDFPKFFCCINPKGCQQFVNGVGYTVLQDPVPKAEYATAFGKVLRLLSVGNLSSTFDFVFYTTSVRDPSLPR